MTPGIVAESDLSGATKSEYVFFAGERVARRDGVNGAGGVFYYFSDHLKTASVITDATGTIKSESDYYPWGGELQLVNNDSNHYKFTGKERDTETGLDYFGARYYSNALGRFITPDWAAKPITVAYADFSDPQTLNLYTYVRNIPTTRYDSDGHCVPLCLAGAAAGGGSIALESGGAALLLSNPVGWTIVGVAAVGTAGYLIYRHYHKGSQAKAAATSPQSTPAVPPPPPPPGPPKNQDKKAQQLKANKAKGKAFENKVVSETKATDNNVAEQVTLKTESGTKTRMDVVSQNESGQVRLQEAKASADAPLTPNQAAAHPEIEQSGATVVGEGKPGYPGGTKIPPTKVEVVRPQQ